MGTTVSPAAMDRPIEPQIPNLSVAPIDPKLVALLADPTDPDRTPLELRDDRLVNPRTGTSFPIVDGVPQLLPENALAPQTAESGEENPA